MAGSPSCWRTRKRGTGVLGNGSDSLMPSSATETVVPANTAGAEGLP
jgi:hypothetical protein